MDDLRSDQRRYLIDMVGHAQKYRVGTTFTKEASFIGIYPVGTSYRADSGGDVAGMLLGLDESSLELLSQQGYVQLAHVSEYTARWTLTQKAFVEVDVYLKPRWRKFVRTLWPENAKELRGYIYPTLFASIGAAILLTVWTNWAWPLIKRALGID